MRKWIAGLAAGIMIGVTVPAVADHITEPQNPITGIRELILFNYPDFSTALACDGTDVIDFTQMAVWVKLNAQTVDGRPLVATGDPSEHYDVSIRVLDSRKITFWSAGWTHQNKPAHYPGAATDFRFSLWHLQHSPKWTVIVKVTGQESGNVFVSECKFAMDPTVTS